MAKKAESKKAADKAVKKSVNEEALENAIAGALAILDPSDIGAPVPGSPGQNIEAIKILRVAIGKE